MSPCGLKMELFISVFLLIGIITVTTPRSGWGFPISRPSFFFEIAPLSGSLACYIKSFYFIPLSTLLNPCQCCPFWMRLLSTQQMTLLQDPPHLPPGPLPGPPPYEGQPQALDDPGHPNPLSLPHTQPPSQLHALAPLLPLQEVAGAEGIVRVHVPFSTTDLSQIECCLGSYSTDPTAYAMEFEYVAQSYDFTWHDIYIILTSSLTPEEKEQV